jgi:rhodanese-related sulfurtransferase
MDFVRNGGLQRQQHPRSLFDANGAVTKEEIYPMSYAEVSVSRAKELLDSDEGYAYVDVRSEAEFLAGRPADAVNIPLFHRNAQGLVPNPDFVQVTEACFAKDARVLVGCQAGGRSAQAARALVAAGFTDVTNVQGGFGGQRDVQGTVIARGWQESGLPVEQGEDAKRCYAAMVSASRE